MRDTYHAEMDRLLDSLSIMGNDVIDMLDGALVAMTSQDVDAADRVRRRDDDIDARYVENQTNILRLLALQAPVASDLRLIAAMLHVNIHIERMGDYATSVAKLVKLSRDLLDKPELAQQLQEMGTVAQNVGRAAFRSFTHRDAALAATLPALDDDVDRLNIGIFKRLVELARDDRLLEWATHMILVARHIERWGDHAVDIGEQTIFVVTGETVELSSNSPAGAVP